MITRTPHRPLARRGFTLIELGAVIATLGASAAAFSVAAPVDKARATARLIKDSTQIKHLTTSLIVWAQGNRDVYPLPSKLDTRNVTVKEIGGAKDTTANIWSLLVWNGQVTPELLISPLENNVNVKADKNYEYSNPTSAVKPADAMWNPGFSVDFTGGKTGRGSYAHLQPAGDRLNRWSNTFKADEAIISTRGPEVTGVQYLDGDLVQPVFAKADSNTFKMFPVQSPGAWAGNVAFNDNHVEFISDHFKPGRPLKTALRFTDNDGKALPDVSFYDEPTDPSAVNTYLGIFTAAGEKPAAFKAIWD